MRIKIVSILSLKFQKNIRISILTEGKRKRVPCIGAINLNWKLAFSPQKRELILWRWLDWFFFNFRLFYSLSVNCHEFYNVSSPFFLTVDVHSNFVKIEIRYSFWKCSAIELILYTRKILNLFI